MGRMCEAPGCGELACYAVGMDDFKIHFCLSHKETFVRNLPQVQRQLADHAHGAPCMHSGCGSPAVVQVYVKGGPFNHCETHARRIITNLTILNGKPPKVEPLRTFYDVPPAIIVEELPVG